MGTCEDQKDPAPGFGDVDFGQSRTIAFATLITTCIYVLLHQVQAELIIPFQQDTLGLVWSTFPLVALAHGLRVVVAWMFGWYSVPILLPAMAYVLLHRYGFALPPVGSLVALAAILISAPLMITLLAQVGIAARSLQDTRTWWRAILLVGILSSILNSVAVHVLTPFRGTSEEALYSLVIGMFSGVAGLAVVALGLLVIYRRPTGN